MAKKNDPLDEIRRSLKQTEDMRRALAPLGGINSVVETMRSDPVRDALRSAARSAGASAALALPAMPRADTFESLRVAMAGNPGVLDTARRMAATTVARDLGIQQGILRSPGMPGMHTLASLGSAPNR